MTYGVSGGTLNLTQCQSPAFNSVLRGTGRKGESRESRVTAAYITSTDNACSLIDRPMTMWTHSTLPRSVHASSCCRKIAKHTNPNHSRPAASAADKRGPLINESAYQRYRLTTKIRKILCHLQYVYLRSRKARCFCKSSTKLGFMVGLMGLVGRRWQLSQRRIRIDRYAYSTDALIRSIHVDAGAGSGLAKVVFF